MCVVGDVSSSKPAKHACIWPYLVRCVLFEDSHDESIAVSMTSTGNLALSRAFGDFNFKGNKDLPPEKQIVTGTYHACV